MCTLLSENAVASVVAVCACWSFNSMCCSSHMSCRFWPCRFKLNFQDLPCAIWSSIQEALTLDDKKHARSTCNSLRTLANSTTSKARFSSLPCSFHVFPHFTAIC